MYHNHIEVKQKEINEFSFRNLDIRVISNHYDTYPGLAYERIPTDCSTLDNCSTTE